MFVPVNTNRKGFSLLELLVAVAVTAILAGMLFNITTQVMKTQTGSSADLETNQVAQFVLDRIQEDLQCAVYQNDGNIWMAADVLNTTENSTRWITADVPKPESNYSLRLLSEHWSKSSPEIEANGQGLLDESRFGVAGTWLRFFTESPEVDPEAENSGGARAVSYQIIRFGLTSSETSTPRYQLFRSDVSVANTFEAGYNLDPEKPNYSTTGSNGPREAGNLVNPIFDKNGEPSTDFSVAANIVDFGIRAYVFNKKPKGTSYLKQVFPDLNSTTDSFAYRATSRPTFLNNTNKTLSQFPDVVDVMIRILTSEGASELSSFERGLIPSQNGMSNDAAWWEIVERNSEVFVRRIKILSKGL